jgi:hypothetical protein
MTARISQRLARVALACSLALCLVLAGCKEKVSEENFNKIAKGMTISQVENILGAGTDETASAGYNISGGGVMSSQASSEKIYVWKGKDLQIIVTLKDGKVIASEKRPI